MKLTKSNLLNERNAIHETFCIYDKTLDLVTTKITLQLFLMHSMTILFLLLQEANITAL